MSRQTGNSAGYSITPKLSVIRGRPTGCCPIIFLYLSRPSNMLCLGPMRAKNSILDSCSTSIRMFSQAPFWSFRLSKASQTTTSVQRMDFTNCASNCGCRIYMRCPCTLNIEHWTTKLPCVDPVWRETSTMDIRLFLLGYTMGYMYYDPNTQSDPEHLWVDFRAFVKQFHSHLPNWI